MIGKSEGTWKWNKGTGWELTEQNEGRGSREWTRKEEDELGEAFWKDSLSRVRDEPGVL